MLFWHHKCQCASNSLPIPCCGPWHCICWLIYCNNFFPFEQTSKKDKLLSIENKTCFPKRFHLILWEIGPFLHRPNWWNRWFIDYLITFHTSYITNDSCHPHKPKLVKFEECTYELKGQTKVSRGRNTNGNQLGNYPCNTRMIGGFSQCWTLDMRGWGTFFYMPNPTFGRSF